MIKAISRIGLSLLWGAMLLCTPGMSCAHTIAKREATFSRPLHQAELTKALESTPGVEFTGTHFWDRRFLFIPAGRVEFYNLSAGTFSGLLQHLQDSPDVQVKFFTVNRGPTEAERKRASELLSEVLSGIERATGFELEKHR